MAALTRSSHAPASRGHSSPFDFGRAYLDVPEVTDQHGPGSWQHTVFAELAAKLASPERPYPCAFAQEGLEGNNLRYLFVETLMPASIAPQLARFLREARTIGPNTALVVFTHPAQVKPIMRYYLEFCEFLDGLRSLDEARWPANVPRDSTQEAWRFCFGGEPVFVSCSTPAQLFRQGRKSTSLTLTFKPAWTVDRYREAIPFGHRPFFCARAELERYEVVRAPAILSDKDKAELRSANQYFLFDWE